MLNHLRKYKQSFCLAWIILFFASQVAFAAHEASHNVGEHSVCELCHNHHQSAGIVATTLAVEFPHFSPFVLATHDFKATSAPYVLHHSRGPPALI